MKILIIGSGGREHALAWKISQSKKAKQIFIAPGNAGTTQIGKNIDISVDNLNSLLDFVLKEKIDLTVVGPEIPLAKGIVDIFSKKGLKIFGPSQKAARLESSKAWANRFMNRHNIPCPEFKIFSDSQKAKKFIKSSPWHKLVIKASGLAGGKGVLLPDSQEEAIKAVKRIMVDKEFKESGDTVVIQERILGEEVSLIAFSDGKTVVPLLPAQDHKPVYDSDQGPNTGGMGAYVPVPFINSTLIDEIKNTILQPAIDGMRQEGHPFKGMLYAGLMIISDGPKVLEFNVRFGDPETQPQMMLLKSDLLPILLSCIEGKLNSHHITFHKGAADCVVLASKGYPGSYKKGKIIYGLNSKKDQDIQVFHAGTKAGNGQILTNSGRVLGVTAYGNDIVQAFNKVYTKIGKQGVYFKDMHYRKDIGRKTTKLLAKPHRIEIASAIKDARAQMALNKLKSLGFNKVNSAWVVDVYTIDKLLDLQQLGSIASMLADPQSQNAFIDKPYLSADFSWAIEIGYLPGVTDNIAATTKEAIKDLLGVKFDKSENVYSSKLLLVKGRFKEKEVQEIAKTLYNPLIKTVRIKSAPQFLSEGGMEVVVPQVKLKSFPSVTWVDLNVSDQELETMGKKGIPDNDGNSRGPLALDLTYMKAIQAYFKKIGRNPTDIELETIAQTWSEHCKHTIFTDTIDEIKDGLFKTYIKGATEKIRKKKRRFSKDKDFCVSVFTDNSGAIEFDENYLITDKVETHNSPSALDPFGGSITGIVGVNRDTIGFGMGAKPIINRYGFCLAEPDDETVLYKGPDFTQKMLSARRIMDGVIEGVNVGGNCSGIPTPQGFLFFDRRYRGKPLVFVGTVGLIPKKIDQKETYKKRACPGDHIVMIGGRVGLDGIHGATFSSEAMDAASPAGAVQIGDPITQKKLSDALVKEARDLGLYSSITDNGAGGLSCSVAEMAKECGGCEVQLDKVPLKYPGLSPWQTWISESQERMTLAVPPKKWSKFKKLMDKHGVEAAIIGTFNDSGKCVVAYNQQTVMDIEMEFLHNGLPVRPMQTKRIRTTSINYVFPEPSDYKSIILQLLARPNVAGFEFLSTQYDHEVQGGSVLKPLQGKGRVNTETTVIKPLLDSPKAVVISQGICPNFSDFDTYHMAACAIDTAIRNAVAVGANIDYLALLDNFCWCSSNEPERLWQLKQAVKACHDYALIYETPFISGKDSMFNDFKGFDEQGNQLKISVPPTLLISSLGVINDASKVVSLDLKVSGDLIYLLGETHDELTGSEYYRLLAQKKEQPVMGINLPRVNAYQNRQLYSSLYQCIQKDLIASTISVGRGGLAAAIAKTCIAGMLGADICLKAIPGSVSQNDHALFSESQGRILITITPQNKTMFESLTKHIPKALIGKVIKKPTIIITGENKVKLVKINLLKAYQAYHQTFKDY